MLNVIIEAFKWFFGGIIRSVKEISNSIETKKLEEQAKEASFWIDKEIRDRWIDKWEKSHPNEDLEYEDKEKKNIEGRKKDQENKSKDQENRKIESPKRNIGFIIRVNYDFFMTKAKENGEKNFKMKKRLIRSTYFGILLMLVLSFMLLLLPYLTLNNTDTDEWKLWIFLLKLPIKIEITQARGTMAFLMVLLAAWIYTSVKKIEIYKPQETWVRHRRTLYRMQVEMLRYCECLEPYNIADRNVVDRLFTLRMLSIFDNNINKFADNMENKEASLSDLPAQLNFKKE